MNFLKIYDHEITPSSIDILKNNKSLVIFLESENINCIAAMRKFFFELMQEKIENPIIISRKYEFNDDEQLCTLFVIVIAKLFYVWKNELGDNENIFERNGKDTKMKLILSVCKTYQLVNPFSSSQSLSKPAGVPL